MIEERRRNRRDRIDEELGSIVSLAVSDYEILTYPSYF